MTCHSFALDFTTEWIRFWFPWVRLWEAESVEDDRFQIQKVETDECSCEECHYGLGPHYTKGKK